MRAGAPQLLEHVLSKGAAFAFRADFRLEDQGSPSDAALKGQFDIIYAHSVASHLGTSQLHAFFAAVAHYLEPLHGRALFSLCLCRACGPGDGGGGSFAVPLGPTGTCDESGEAFWVYPYVSWFSPASMTAAAAPHGLVVAWNPALRGALNDELVRLRNGGSDAHVEHQDWIVATHAPREKAPSSG
jgi:hypothetical protein